MLFLSILAAGAVSLELLSAKLFGPDEARTDIRRKLGQLQPEDLGGIEVMVLGNSHAQAGLRAKLFTRKVKNLAHGSQDLYYDLRIFTKYGTRSPDLKAVVLTLDPYIFGFRVEMIDRIRVGAYAAAGIPPAASGGTLRDELEKRSYFLRYRTILIKKLLSEWRGGVLREQEKGMDEASGSMTESQRRREAAVRANFHRSSCMDASFEASNEEYLRTLIHGALDRGVAVRLIVLPFSEEYRQAVDPALWERFHASLGRVMEGFTGEDVTFTSFLEDPDFGPADYYDSDHLNESGAAKLAPKVEALLPA